MINYVAKRSFCKEIYDKNIYKLYTETKHIKIEIYGLIWYHQVTNFSKEKIINE